MKKGTKVGLMIILLGIFIPLILFPYTSIHQDSYTYHKHGRYSYIQLIPKMRIIIPIDSTWYWSVNYGYIISSSLILIFLGIVVVVWTRGGKG